MFIIAEYLELYNNWKGKTRMNRSEVIKIILILCISIATSFLTLYLEIHDLERCWFIFAPTTVSYVAGSLIQDFLSLSVFYERLFAFIISIIGWYIPVSLLVNLKYPTNRNSFGTKASICIVTWIAPFILHAITKLNI